MPTDRIVSWFSCGAASAVATKLAIITNGGKLPFVVARCMVEEESTDNDRFAADCAKWFGLPITSLINEKYQGSIFEVFRLRKFISGNRGAPCTIELKRRLRERFETPRDRHIFGYTADPKDAARFDDFLDANNIDAIAPLIDGNLTHADCLAMVQDAGIELPLLYRQGFKHNNCIGCCKASGAGYWNKVRDLYPAQFERMARVSRMMNVKIIKVGGKRVFLDTLQPGTGDYATEPEIQCGIFCEIAKREINDADQA